MKDTCEVSNDRNKISVRGQVKPGLHVALYDDDDRFSTWPFSFKDHKGQLQIIFKQKTISVYESPLCLRQAKQAAYAVDGDFFPHIKAKTHDQTVCVL